MNWHDYLRRERKEKLKSIETFSSGRVRSFTMTDGVQEETTREYVAELESHVVEIEQILRSAGEPIE